MQKPGSTITPASFAVAPELLGKPLAPPSRRAAAMAIDLVLLGILVKGSGLFFGLAAAFALWRASARTGVAARRPRLRKILRLSAAVVLFVMVASSWGGVTRPFRRLASDSDESNGGDADSAELVANRKTVSMNAGLGDLAALGEVMGLRRARNPADARREANRLVGRLKKSGLTADAAREMRQGLQPKAGEKDTVMSPMALVALDSAIAAAFPADSAGSTAGVTNPDSLARLYVRALTREDTEAAEALRPRLGVAFASDTLDELRQRVGGLTTENRQLRARVRRDSVEQASRPAGLLASVADVSGEVGRLLKKAGLGFGWTGLYFVGFVALMRGQTPGKWFMRIRIVRLDGRPMGWWAALERFGGYAASVVTALGGFFQILWDKNRQAMHDKIAETVVVRV